MTHAHIQKITSWVVSLGFPALGLLYLNAALFSAWMSGGPPNPYPHGWGRLATGQLSTSAASFVLAVASYKLVISLPAWRRTPIALIVFALFLAIAPYIGRTVLHGQCVSQKGEWSNLTLECSVK